MRFSFAGFELDDSARRLLRGGREVPVQRRVFDLLAYLLRHRDRVVSKDELIAAVWSGAFVADNAVLRAVSVARRLLRPGGGGASIRTYPRQGYRYAGEVTVAPGADGSAPDGDIVDGDIADEGSAAHAALAAARAAFEQASWGEAAAGFARADAASARAGGPAPTARDLETWGEAHENRCRPAEAVAPLQRAVAAFVAAGDRRGAARAAVRLASLHLERGEAAVARGWSRRAARSLEGVEECREAGLLAWLACRFALYAGDVEEALRQGEHACRLGQRLGDPDLEALGLVYRGSAHLLRGEVERGAALLDEAGASVLTGETSAWVAGLVYCTIVWSCMSCGDLARAAAWTQHFGRWCADRGVAGYPGLCRLHRAEVLTARGELAAAEREAADACAVLAEAIPLVEGEAHRVLGEALLARGDLGGAEAAFRRAYDLGCEPQPGLALLRLAQGRGEAAVQGLERAIELPGLMRQRRGVLLAHLALVAAVTGRAERAEEALAELASRPDLGAPCVAAATAARAGGELALAAGDTAAAARRFRRAVAVWNGVPSPANAAGVRLRLVECLERDGDLDGAALELSAAQSAFERLGLPALVAACRERRGGIGALPERSGRARRRAAGGR